MPELFYVHTYEIHGSSEGKVQNLFFNFYEDIKTLLNESGQWSDYREMRPLKPMHFYLLIP